MSAQTKESSSTRMQDKATFTQRAAVDRAVAPAGVVTQAAQEADNLLAQLQAQIQSALEEYQMRPVEQIAEPYPWWDLYCWGPWQPGANTVPPNTFSSPLLPNEVIRVGQTAYVATILVLNTIYPNPALSAAEILSTFALPYQIEYRTGELEHWQPGPAYLQHNSGGNLVPHVPYAVDLFGFTAQSEGLFEMNVLARILGANGNIAPPFAGFATRVINLDSDMFGITPHVQQDIPIRFQVYQ